MKNFIAQIDISIIEIVPQKAQLDILKTILKKNENIVNHSIENIETRDDFLSLKNILSNSKNIDGVIFFSLIQFCYDNSKNINLKFLNTLSKNYEIIFFRENIIIKNNKDFKNLEKKLKLFKINNLNIINKFKY
tara:strand:- start:1301 stop:1702 length:402 start_codon:yes stop_codon:yes gene_type:complete